MVGWVAVKIVCRRVPECKGDAKMHKLNELHIHEVQLPLVRLRHDDAAIDRAGGDGQR